MGQPFLAREAASQTRRRTGSPNEVRCSPRATAALEPAGRARAIPPREPTSAALRCRGTPTARASPAGASAAKRVGEQMGAIDVLVTMAHTR